MALSLRNGLIIIFWNLRKLIGYLTRIISSNLEKQHMTKVLFLIKESQKTQVKDSISKITKWLLKIIFKKLHYKIMQKIRVLSNLSNHTYKQSWENANSKFTVLVRKIVKDFSHNSRISFILYFSFFILLPEFYKTSYFSQIFIHLLR